MSDTLEVALTTVPPSVIRPHSAQLLTYRAGDPHSAHCCTHFHLQTAGKSFYEDKETDKREGEDCDYC